MDDIIYLVSQTWEPDSIGQMIPSETSRPVWAHLQSVTRAEWYDAGQKGLQPQLVAVTPIVNYQGELIVRVGEGDAAKRYAVYRTYFGPDSDTIELYLQREVGVIGAESKTE